MDDLKTILDRIRKPLLFASRDNFAHMGSLSGIESFIKKQLGDLNRISRGHQIIGRLESLFAGFDLLQPEEKKDRIRKASIVIDSFSNMQETSPATSHPLKEASPHTGQVPPHPGPLPRGEMGQRPEESRETAHIKLETPVQYIKGIGPKKAALLKKIGLITVEDALFYLPWRYEDRSNLKKIGQVSIGSCETVMGTVISAEVVQTKRRWVKVFELVITDRSGFLVGSWFNQPFMQKAFKTGQTVILSGIVKSNSYRGGRPQIDNPEYEIMDENEQDNLIHTGRVVPIYRTTSGLSVRYLRSMIKEIVDSCAPAVAESLPEYLVRKYALMHPAEALSEVHFPTREQDISVLNRGTSAAHRRLSFEELLFLEIGLALKKRGVSVEKKGIAFRKTGRFEAELRKKLPFALTGAQKRVLAEIRSDMSAERPMNRLVQGDVGSGKTIVALIACLTAVENGYQACIMAPTEILAEQHYRNIADLCLQLGITVRALTGRLRKKEKEVLLAEIGSGDAQIVVGTHALIEQNVLFKKLGFVVIDEQHRFGVLQRSTLTSKGYHPDVLVMTATPIPRTLALTVYGDLDISVIDAMPPGRSPIVTKLYFEPERRDAYRFIENEMGKGRQAYVVYPLVEETEKSDLKAATEMAVHLQRDIFPKRTVGLLHGRMKSDEKEEAMSAFKAGRSQVLVSTTVIEVGVDVPNATVMAIEHPERFGLAQLHQLRGRVGRGAHQSWCILMGPRMFAPEARDRLLAFSRTLDGFKIAEEDLKLRGPGEFFGTRQSGLPDLRAANILRDAELLELARAEAFSLITADDPDRCLPQLLMDRVAKKWRRKLGLITAG